MDAGIELRDGSKERTKNNKNRGKEKKRREEKR
jgi:hypothetical protein